MKNNAVGRKTEFFLEFLKNWIYLTGVKTESSRRRKILENRHSTYAYKRNRIMLCVCQIMQNVHTSDKNSYNVHTYCSLLACIAGWNLINFRICWYVLIQIMCTNHKNRLLWICAWILWFLYNEAQNLYLVFHLVKAMPLKGDVEWFLIEIVLNITCIIAMTLDCVFLIHLIRCSIKQVPSDSNRTIFCHRKSEFNEKKFCRVGISYKLKFSMFAVFVQFYVQTIRMRWSKWANKGKSTNNKNFPTQTIKLWWRRVVLFLFWIYQPWKFKHFQQSTHFEHRKSII